jgi:hypothetical protein
MISFCFWIIHKVFNIQLLSLNSERFQGLKRIMHLLTVKNGKVVQFYGTFFQTYTSNLNEPVLSRLSFVIILNGHIHCEPF